MHMRSRHFFAVGAAVIAAALVFGVINRSEAQNPPAALTGVVSSQQDGQLEGVMVSARRAGSTVTVTVATNAQGRYAFPRNRLEPGSYSIGIRAVGYELDGPASAQVSAQQTSQLDLKLRKAQDLASQLSNGEWFLSWPGSVEMKNGLLNCTQCHGLDLIARSRYTAKEWVTVLERMGRYSQGSMPGRPQFRPGRTSGSPILAQSMGREGEPPVRSEVIAKTAEYLASVNLSSSSTWSYPLKTYPRPTGKATQVVITEYDLPRPEAMPHDAAADANGMIWYADFGSQVIGMLNPKTGAVADYQMPITKPGAPLGSL